MYFETYTLAQDSKLTTSVIMASISAGEPLELEAALERIDLNKLFARSDETLVLRVHGDSMEDVPIFDKDWIILDRLKRPEAGNIIVARLNGGYTIKYYKLNDSKGNAGLYLVPANGAYKPRKITKKDDYEILGVVTFIIHPTI